MRLRFGVVVAIGFSVMGVSASARATASAVAAKADVQHIVAKGHTLEAIANRYRVSRKAILAANHMSESDARHLQVGEVLTIPKVDVANAKSGEKVVDAKAAKGDKGDKGTDKKGASTKPVTYAAKPKTPGVVHVKRIATTEEADIRVADRHGKVQPDTLKRFEKLMRSAGGQAHPIEPRLLSLLTTVSNHFGSRKIEIISGFRPYTPTQYNPHSNHNHGKAIDFRVVGVPNEVLRDYCRTLKNVGCGYYPNSVFVHMDVRASSAFWIDYSKPGEPPRYNGANVEADEGTSDVNDGMLPGAAPPAESESHDGPKPEAAPEGALPPAPTTPLEGMF